MSDPKEKDELKVTDKRRFTQQGEPVASPAREEKPKPAAPTEPPKGKDMPAGTGTRPEPYEGAGEAEARHAYAQHSPGHAQASGQPINFDTLVFSLASQAMIFLGDVADDEGKRHTDPALARQMIDLLGILREKTRGNLSPDEDRFLGDTLRDLRLHFVAVTGAKGQT